MMIGLRELEAAAVLGRGLFGTVTRAAETISELRECLARLQAVVGDEDHATISALLEETE